MDYKTYVVSSLLSSSSDSEDELELLDLLGTQREIPKITNFVESVVHNFSDKEVCKIEHYMFLNNTILCFQFQQNFRLSRDTVNWLIDYFKNSSSCPKDIHHGGKVPISPEKHILSFLW